LNHGAQQEDSLMIQFQGGFKTYQNIEPGIMHYFSKSLALAVALLVGIELGNTYSIQLADNLPSREVFESYFGVLSPLAMKFYLYQHKHVKIDSIS
jgi:hypothetical protein